MNYAALSVMWLALSACLTSGFIATKTVSASGRHIHCARASPRCNRIPTAGIPAAINKPSEPFHFQLTATESVDAIEPAAWDFVDDVFLITTSISTGRFERTKAELQRAKLWDKVNVRTFEPDNEDRVRGCYTSHIAVLQEVQRKFARRQKRNDYKVLILEDNLEITNGLSFDTIRSVQSFTQKDPSWDVFHLAYMMYVPNLNLVRYSPNPDNEAVTNTDISSSSINNKDWQKNIVQMIASSGASVGTSSYLISKSGVEKLLQLHNKQGYVEAIPNVMAEVFPSSRYAAYPMMFHRAGKVGSLVNPQLDDFRRIMFNPSLYGFWENLMVTTGLQNNQLFPGLVMSLLLIIISGIVSLFTSRDSSSLAGDMASSSTAAGLLVALFPLAVALWGASLFKPGNKGAGFAASTQQSMEE